MKITMPKQFQDFFEKYWIVDWKYSWTIGNTEYFMERRNSVFYGGILFIFPKFQY